MSKNVPADSGVPNRLCRYVDEQPSGPIKGAKHEGITTSQRYRMGFWNVPFLCSHWRCLLYGY